MRRHSVLIGVASAFIATSALAASPCVTVSLNPPPQLATGLMWDWNANKLLLVDILAGELQTYAADGVRLTRWANPGSGPYNFSQPMWITRSPKALVLTNYGGKFIELDARLTPVASHELSTFEADPRHGELGPDMSHWAVTGDGMVGLGTTRLKGERWSGAWIRVRWSPRNGFEVLREVRDDGPYWGFQVLASYIMATLDQRVYALSFEPYGVLEFEGSGMRLRAGLPEAFGKLPALPPDQGRINLQDRVAILSSSTGAAHLYADGSRLYVVLRDMRSGARKWLLARYDPEAQRVTGVWRLPSRSHDLFLAPGPKQWALLEIEGRRSDYSDIYGKLVLFPTQALTGSAGTVDTPVPVCDR